MDKFSYRALLHLYNSLNENSKSLGPNQVMKGGGLVNKENKVMTRKLTDEELKNVEKMFDYIHALFEAMYEYETKK